MCCRASIFERPVRSGSSLRFQHGVADHAIGATEVLWATPQEDSPAAILKRRYARGEINREKYDQRLNDLRK